MAEIRFKNGHVAYVDDEDAVICLPFRWHMKIVLSRQSGVLRYAYGELYEAGSRRRIFLHRLVMKVADNDTRIVDHRDGDGLNCRKGTLRFATFSQQMYNRRPYSKSPKCPYTGVYNHKLGFYRVQVRNEHVKYYLGEYASAEHAARVYDSFIARTRGEFAVLNFDYPDGVPVVRPVMKHKKFFHAEFYDALYADETPVFVRAWRRPGGQDDVAPPLRMA